MFNRTLPLLMALLFTACASTHPGNLGKSTSGESKIPLKISAQNIDESKKDAFQLIEVTLENTSENWLKIEKSHVVLGDPMETKLSVVLGDDLKAWAQAASYREKQDQHNREMAQLGLLGAGAAAAIVGGSRGDAGLATVGSAVVVGTYSWALTDAVNASLHEAERSEKIPENHLYHSASVAPTMYLRRWVLINKPVGQLVKTLVLEVQTVEGERETYAINL